MCRRVYKLASFRNEWLLTSEIGGEKICLRNVHNRDLWLERFPRDLQPIIFGTHCIKVQDMHNAWYLADEYDRNSGEDPLFVNVKNSNLYARAPWADALIILD